MMRIIVLLIISIISFSVVIAQDATENETTIKIKAGTEFSARLKTEINAEKIKVGADLKFELMQDLSGEGGKILKGAEIYGRVVSVQEFSAKNGSSKVELRFDFIKHGEEFLFLSGSILSGKEISPGIKFNGSTEIKDDTIISLAGKNLLIESGKELSVKLIKDLS